MTTEETLDKIIKAVTCNGMRELEEERCRQIAEEYALVKVNQARQEEIEKFDVVLKQIQAGIAAREEQYTKLRDFAKEIMRNHQPNSWEYQDAKEALAAAGYEGKEEA